MFAVRIAAIVGGAALVLSLLTGLFGGAGFGLSLLRAVSAGAVFFGLCAAGELFLRKFLPELFSGEFVTESSGGDNDPGVDILIDDEEDPVLASSLDAIVEDDTDPGDEYTGEQGIGDDFIEEVGPEEARDADEADEVEIADLAIDDMEELPGLDSFSESFDTFTSGDSDSGVNMTPRDLDVDILGDNQNIKDVTQAIRTAMKRDQKG